MCREVVKVIVGAVVVWFEGCGCWPLCRCENRPTISGILVVATDDIPVLE